MVNEMEELQFLQDIIPLQVEARVIMSEREKQRALEKAASEAVVSVEVSSPTKAPAAASPPPTTTTTTTDTTTTTTTTTDSAPFAAAAAAASDTSAMEVDQPDAQTTLKSVSEPVPETAQESVPEDTTPTTTAPMEE